MAAWNESFAEAWTARYGEQGEEPLLPEWFLRHRSVRQFDSRPVSEGLLRQLMACAQSASTSSNLQLWSVILVEDPRLRDRVATLCADQKHVRDAPIFLAFLADHYRLKKAAEKAGIEPAGLDFMEFFVMAVIDASLAAERLVVAAESVGLGACYIGALRNDPSGIAEALGLPEGVFGAFGLCLGYPAAKSTAEIKPRLPQEQMLFTDRYDPDVDASAYDERMRSFYESQGMKGEVTWSMRSGRRADGSEKSLTGRGVLKEWLEKRGFNRR